MTESGPLQFILLLISCIAFLAFLALTLAGTRARNSEPETYTPEGILQAAFVAGTVGWAGMVILLFSELPYYFSLNNFLYPLIAILSVPFLYITGKFLLKGNPLMVRLTMAAAVAFLIYAPFEYIEPLGNWLIGVVAGEVQFILVSVFHYPSYMDAWNIIRMGSFRVEIILACTGVQSIAIMLGITAAVPTTTRQKILAFLLVVPTIYFLNLLRNTFVVMAYTGQWYPYYPDIAGNGEIGYESFFWAHNVMAELGALIILILIAYGLFRLIPQLGDYARDLFDFYCREVRKVFGKDTGSAG
ncbi:MAG: archaeosortase A [Methanoregulaceae archaeon]